MSEENENKIDEENIENSSEEIHEESNEEYIEIKKADNAKMVLVVAVIMLLISTAFCVYAFVKEPSPTQIADNKEIKQEQQENDEENKENATESSKEEQSSEEDADGVEQEESTSLAYAMASAAVIDPYVPAENTSKTQTGASTYQKPIISGVQSGYTYKGSVTPTFSIGTGSLNGTTYKSGTRISVDGIYTLKVTNGNYVTTVSFAIDNGSPTISLNGGDITLNVGENFSDPGVSVYDAVSSASQIRINKSIIYSPTGEYGSWSSTSAVNTSNSGYYIIEYSATDAVNNTSGTVRRTVTIMGSPDSE